jgi:hypothetical protein
MEEAEVLSGDQGRGALVPSSPSDFRAVSSR